MRTPRRNVATDGTETWTVRFRREVDGKREETSETFEVEDVAWRFAELMDRYGADRAAAVIKREASEAYGIPTLDQWFEQWDASRTGVEDETRDKDRSMYERHWKPALGALPLDLIDKTAIAGVVNHIAKKGNNGKPYKDKTVRNYHGLLSGVLNAAVEEELIPKNPSQRMRLPRSTEHETEEMRFLTLDEFWTLHAEIPDYWQPLVTTLAGTGIRWSEAEALTIRDVLPDGRLRINKAAKGRGANRYIGPPKSPKSRRTLTLAPEVTEALTPLITDRPATARLFVGPRGGPIRHRTFWSDIWYPAVERAGLEEPRPRIHDLRHFHASRLLNQGWSMYIVQRRLGHESIVTTESRYGHLDIDMEAAAAQAAFASGPVLVRRQLAQAHGELVAAVENDAVIEPADDAVTGELED